MKRPLVMALALATAWLAPMLARANHVPHDSRPNPNCAWDSGRSADWSGDDWPDEQIIGVSANTSFPQQVRQVIGPGVWPPEPVPQWLGAHDGPDDVAVVVQGDHRQFGANPQEDPNDPGNPEQLHNGAIHAYVSYDEIEDDQMPVARVGFGIFEARELIMLCAGTGQDPQVAVCAEGVHIVDTEGECPA